MREIEDYMIVKDESVFNLSKKILSWIKDCKYEILGSTFWNGKEYCQTIVKYSD